MTFSLLKQCALFLHSCKLISNAAYTDMRKDVHYREQIRDRAPTEARKLIYEADAVDNQLLQLSLRHPEIVMMIEDHAKFFVDLSGNIRLIIEKMDGKLVIKTALLKTHGFSLNTMPLYESLKEIHSELQRQRHVPRKQQPQQPRRLSPVERQEQLEKQPQPIQETEVRLEPKIEPTINESLISQPPEENNELSHSDRLYELIKSFFLSGFESLSSEIIPEEILDAKIRKIMEVKDIGDIRRYSFMTGRNYAIDMERKRVVRIRREQEEAEKNKIKDEKKKVRTEMEDELAMIILTAEQDINQKMQSAKESNNVRLYGIHQNELLQLSAVNLAYLEKIPMPEWGNIEPSGSKGPIYGDKGFAGLNKDHIYQLKRRGLVKFILTVASDRLKEYLGAVEGASRVKFFRSLDK